MMQETESQRQIELGWILLCSERAICSCRVFANKSNLGLYDIGSRYLPEDGDIDAAAEDCNWFARARIILVLLDMV